jgi:hypothetical protein
VSAGSSRSGNGAVAEGLGALGAAVLGALLIGAVGFFHWWSAFGMAMSVSDELPPGVGGVTPLGAVIEGGGVLVGLAGAAFGVLALVLRQPGHVAVRAVQRPVDNRRRGSRGLPRVRACSSSSAASGSPRCCRSSACC